VTVQGDTPYESELLNSEICEDAGAALLMLMRSFVSEFWIRLQEQDIAGL
jgi:hypothetical protein